MNCPNAIELNMFLKGGLSPERIADVGMHIAECEACRESVCNAPAYRKFASELGEELLGVRECPEYEQLSGYVDRSLDVREMAAVQSHLNMCETCAGDADMISQMRAHATLREKITVGPGISRVAARPWFPVWAKGLAGVSVAAVLVAVALSTGNINSPAQKHSPALTIAAKPDAAKPAATPSVPKTILAAKPEQKIAPAPSMPVVAMAPKPAQKLAAVQPKALLKDGRYSVIEQGGRLALAANGARTPLEAKIARSIDEKLRTGRVAAGHPVQVAMADTMLRSEAKSVANPNAPIAISPANNLILSDKPVLKWSNVDQAEQYRVKVYNQSGKVLLDRVTLATSVALDRTLPRGEMYTWRVGVKFGDGDDWTESAPAKFQVVSAEGFEAIRDAQRLYPGSHLALGAAYESAGLIGEAKREYAAVRAANPGSDLAKKLR